MANFKLLFLDENEENNIQIFATSSDKIYISINDDEIGNQFGAGCISLDIDTAIKLSKELRRQIALLKSQQ